MKSISLNRSHVSKGWRAGRLRGTFRDRQEKALETEHLSVWDLYEGKPEGGFLYCGFWIYKMRLWRWRIHIYVGAP